jgi:hypothetical protein
LFVGLNAGGAGELFAGLGAGGVGEGSRKPGSFLRLDIRASGCGNPVVVEGSLERAEGAWSHDAQANRRVKPNEPESAHLVGRQPGSPESGGEEEEIGEQAELE